MLTPNSIGFGFSVLTFCALPSGFALVAIAEPTVESLQ